MHHDRRHDAEEIMDALTELDRVSLGVNEQEKYLIIAFDLLKVF